MHEPTRIDSRQSDAELLKRLPAAIQKALSMETANRSLVVNRVWVDTSRHEKLDYDDLQEAKNREGTLSAPIFADISLLERPTGKELSRKKAMRIGNLPMLTPHGGYLINGVEYAVHHQLRLDPSIYTVVKDNGELVSTFNLSQGSKGRRMGLHYSPADETLNLTVGTSRVPLLPVLNALGVPLGSISKTLGDEFVAQNMAAVKDPGKAVLHAAQLLTGESHDTVQRATEALREYFRGTRLNSKTTARALGEEPREEIHGTLSPELLLSQSAKHMAVYRGDAHPDDRNSLLHKTIHGIEDHVPGRFLHWKNQRLLKSKIMPRMDAFDSVDRIISSSDVTGVINKYFLSSGEGGAGLIQVSEQNNPVQISADTRRITMLGEGGISGTHSVPNSVRMIHPSQFGITDPLNSPEGGKVGVMLTAAGGARRIGGRLGTELFNPHTGVKETLALDDYYDKPVAMADQFSMNAKGFLEPRGRVVRAIKDGKVGMYRPEEVAYVMPSAAQMFGGTARLVPMLGATSGARAMIGVKMIEQALPLVDAEAPLVRSISDNVAPVEDPAVGGARTADEDGVVESVEPGKIFIRDKGGRRLKHGLYDYFPSQSGALFHHTPLVKPGDEVKKGQVIADSSFSKGGHLAVGKNLTTAYLPAKGLSHEDGIVISESAARKLTSKHMSVKEFDLDEDSFANRDKFRVAYPGQVSEEHAARLDDDGVIKVGETVAADEPLILGLKRRMPSEEEAVLSRVSKRIYKPLVNAAVSWDQDGVGKVVKVEKLGHKIKVYVAHDSQMTAGDKMSGFGYGSKAIVTKILPDDEMPVTRGGDRVEVMFNPLGTIGRTNPSAPLETMAAKIARHDGKPFYVSSFTDENYDQMIGSELQKRGLSDREDLLDPQTGRVIPGVMVGPQYYMKLKHRVASKFSARDTAGYDIDGQPLRGGEEGAKRTDPLQMYAILAHGAHHVLQDVAVNKSNRDDEKWRLIKTGQPLPPPQPTFATMKLLALMNAAGINPVKTGDRITLMPLTDRDVLAQSNGEVTNPGSVHGDEFTAVPQGLFDPAIVGGMQRGSKWSHVALSEPMPNPVMEPALRSTLGITEAQLSDLMSGKIGLASDMSLVPYQDGMPTAGAALTAMLSTINPSDEFAKIREQLQTEKSQSAIDKLSKRGKYMRGLMTAGQLPGEAYMINHVPVLPPNYRPLVPLPDGQISWSGLNGLYRDLLLVNNKLKSFSDMGPEHANPLRASVYDSIKAIQGLGDPISNRDYKGVFKTVAGFGEGSPKGAYIQRKLLGRPMDAVGRSTIIPDPDLHIDEVGIPEDMAWRIYQPFAIQEMVKVGIPPLQAATEMDKRSERASRALDMAMAKRPALLNRAPSLHKFSVLAFNAKRVPGDAIQMPPLVFKGFNADTDGDSFSGEAIICYDGGPPTTVQMRDLFPYLEKIEGDYKNDVYKPKRPMRVLSVSCGTSPGWSLVDQVSVHKNLWMRDLMVSGIPGRLRVSEDASIITVNPENGFQRATTPAASMGAMVVVANSFDCSSIEGRGGDPDDDFRRGVEDGREGARFVQLLDTKRADRSSHPLVGDFCERPKAYRTGFVLGKMSTCMLGKQRTPMFGSARWASAIRFMGMSAGLELRFFGDEASQRMIQSISMDMPTASLIFRNFAKHHGPVFSGLADGLESKLLDFVKRIGESRALHEFGDHKSAFNHPKIYALNGRLHLDAPALTKRRFVPFPWKAYLGDLESLLRDEVADVKKRVAYHLKKNLLPGDSLRGDEPFVSAIPLLAAAKLLKSLAEVEKAVTKLEFYKILHSFVYNPDVSFERVVGMRSLYRRKTGYDFSVQGPQVFCHASGVSLKNTMMVSVPMSSEAVNEAATTMMPSHNLINPGTHGLMILPSKESVWGVWKMTEAGAKTGKEYPDMDSAMKEYLDGKLLATDVITAGGVETTPGRIEVNALLPEPVRDYSARFDDRKLKEVLQKVAKNDPKGYDEVVMGVKAAGDDAAYYMGMTFGLSDLAPARHIRDKVMGEALRQYEGGPQTKERLLHLFEKANTSLEKGLDEHYEKNPNAIWSMIKSGALGKKGQAMQMISAPGVVNDESGEPIPFPVMKSYSEGLNISDYVSTLYGQRRGIIDRAISTAEPGEIHKEAVVAASRLQITEKDCGAEAVPFPVDDKSIYYRFLGADVHVKGRVVAKRGDPITHEIVDAARAAGMKELPIHSIENDLSQNGICQLAAGLNENGEKYPLGFNIGALAATTISEPLTQGVLRNFHQGNTAFSKTISGLDRIRQLIELPKMVAGEGPLSSTDGKVEEIKKLSSGDFKVTVAGKHHFVPAGMLVQARVGDEVTRGTPLSSGVQNPHEILRTKGVGAARRYIADELQRTYKEGNNIDLDRRHFEVIARTLSDHAYVDDPGDAETLLRGDALPLSRVEAYNKMLAAAGKKPIEYTPQLRGAVQASLATDSWMSRLGSRLLTRKIQEAAGFGLSSSVAGGAHPISRYIYGVHFADAPPEHQNTPSSIQGLKLEDLAFGGPVMTSVHEVPLSKADKVPA